MSNREQKKKNRIERYSYSDILLQYLQVNGTTCINGRPSHRRMKKMAEKKNRKTSKNACNNRENAGAGFYHNKTESERTTEMQKQKKNWILIYSHSLGVIRCCGRSFRDSLLFFRIIFVARQPSNNRLRSNISIWLTSHIHFGGLLLHSFGNERRY